jgi:hypothetical protein
MLYDLIAFKSYICFDFQSFSIYDLYMSYYWPIPHIHQLSNFFYWFLSFWKLLRQFGPDMSDFWP